VDKNIPIVVLVNEYSASSSEIVAGAFQDLDRGVIIGKKTFGKGLVQNIIPLSYNTSLKITVSKYYIPSGRCVQNIDYFSSDTSDIAPVIPDSLATPFKTKNGRTVYDKGGIEPDIITKDSMPSNILTSLVVHNLIFDYANQYHARHSVLAPANEFAIDDALYQDFLTFLKDKNYDYNTDSEMVLEKLKNIAVLEQHFDAIETLYQQMKEKLASDKKLDIQKFKEEISLMLANEIVARYYYQKGRIINSLATDPDITEAKALLKDTARYKSILSGKK
jgi:carboxyl-terminal processing protease